MYRQYVGLHIQCLTLSSFDQKISVNIQNIKSDKKWSSGGHSVPCRQWIGDRPGGTNSHFVHALKNETICSVCCRAKVGPVSTHRKFIVMLSLCWFISHYGAWNLTKLSLKGFTFYGFGYYSVYVVTGFSYFIWFIWKEGIIVWCVVLSLVSFRL